MLAFASMSSVVSGGTRHIASRRVADAAREIADQERDVVPELLELPHFIEQHGVTQVQVRRGRIESGLDMQRFAALQFGNQLTFREQFLRAALELGQLFVEVHHVVSCPELTGTLQLGYGLALCDRSV